MAKIKDQIPSQYDLAFAEGYRQGVLDSCWTCDDCGNLYVREVEFCPNTSLDEANARLRRLEHL